MNSLAEVHLNLNRIFFSYSLVAGALGDNIA